jgi:hypothetical protein
MARPHLPAGMPGSLKWQSEHLGIPAYNLALMAAGQPGHPGHQARFYLAMANHQRMRRLAMQAAGNQQQPQPVAY